MTVNVTALNESLAALQATVATLSTDTAALSSTQEGNSTDINIGWMILCGALVFFMQAGFALLETGGVRAKNAGSALAKNLLDGAIGAILYYLIGYGFSYGASSKPNSFIGSARFALKDAETTEYATFFFQWTFVATAATIVSGAVAERLRFPAFLMQSAFMSGWVYPVVVHAAWSAEGWISPFNTGTTGKVGVDGKGVIDFAGSGVVHLTGGVAALVAAKILGPRLDRFDENGKPRELRGHNGSMTALGTLMLFFSWFGFNCGSTLGLTGGLGTVAARCATTTMIAGMTAAFSAGVVSTAMAKGKRWNLYTCCNGALLGLVGITAGCATVEPWGAFITGVLAGPFYIFASWFVANVLKIDDPIDAGAVHAFGGFLGLMIPGFLAKDTAIEEAYGHDDSDYSGVFMGGKGKQLGFQLLFFVFVVVWTAVNFGLLFTIAKHTFGIRVSKEQEENGLDEFYGGETYEYLGELNRLAGAEERLAALDRRLKRAANAVNAITGSPLGVNENIEPIITPAMGDNQPQFQEVAKPYSPTEPKGSDF